MPVLVATDMRLPRGGDADPLVRLASEAGAEGIHLAGGCLLAELAAVAGAALRAGLAVPAMSLPLPERAPAAGKRLPHLGAADAEERAAALALASAGLAAGVAIGVARALLDFGPVALPVSRAEVARLFARRELDEDEPGAPRLEAAVGARRAQSAALFDACRWSLERLGREAEARGAILLLPMAGTPWGLPSPREAAALIEAFSGAPLAVAWDPGQLSVLRALGLPLSAERSRALARAAGAVVENDAVGMQAGFLPGLGERDPDLPPRPQLPPGAPIIVTGTPDASAGEVAEAVRRVAS